jgi:hypothetical protein
MNYKWNTILFYCCSSFRCKGLILLETYSALENDELLSRLPKFLTLIKEVTGNPDYSMFNLSLKEEWHKKGGRYCTAWQQGEWGFETRDFFFSSWLRKARSHLWAFFFFSFSSWLIKTRFHLSFGGKKIVSCVLGTAFPVFKLHCLLWTFGKKFRIFQNSNFSQASWNFA